MSTRLLSKPVLVVGAAMMFAGLVLAGPSLYNSLRFRVVRGEVLDAFVESTVDGGYRIAFCYSYAIEPGDLADYPDGAQAMGYARCDILGNRIDDLTVDDRALVGDFLSRVRSDQRWSVPVLYDPADPIGSARAPVSADGNLFWTLGSLGMLLMLAPPLSWTALIILRLLRGVNHRR